MKTVIIILSLFIAFAASGCSVKQPALRADNKYFTPLKKLPAKPIQPDIGTQASFYLEKELAKKTTENEVLKKEIQKLRDKIQNMEKKLGVKKTCGAPQHSVSLRNG